MTAIPQPGKQDPEERRRKVEQMLYQASSWTPEREPGDFIAEAIRKRGEPRSRPNPGRRSQRPSGAWWGFGTVGVAAASVLFTMTGKIPVVENELPSAAPTRITASSLPPSAGLLATEGHSDGETTEAATVPAPATRTPDRAGSERARHVRTDRTAVRRALSQGSHSVARKVQTVTPLSEKPATALPPKPSSEAADTGMVATPAPEIYTTEDGRVLVPVVITHTSEDGTEVSYTPTVVEMAYQPVSETAP